MSLIPANDAFDTRYSLSAVEFSDPNMELKEAYWGYIIRDTRQNHGVLLFMQLAAAGLAAAFAVATAGLWALPTIAFTGAAIISKALLSAFFLGMAGVLAWYASRGSRSEMQIDLRLGEVREVVRNHAGRPTLLRRFGFDALGGAFLDNTKNSKGTAVLKIRYRNTAQTIPVAHGSLKSLETLRDRLGRDLLADPGASKKRTPLPAPSYSA